MNFRQFLLLFIIFTGLSVFVWFIFPKFGSDDIAVTISSIISGLFISSSLYYADKISAKQNIVFVNLLIFFNSIGFLISPFLIIFIINFITGDAIGFLGIFPVLFLFLIFLVVAIFSTIISFIYIKFKNRKTKSFV